MDEPTYNIFHPKRDIQEPSGLGLEQIDAFQIKLNWQIDMGDNSEFLDGFIGKRFSSITPVENILEIEFNESFIISLNEIEIDTIDQVMLCTFLDSGSVYGAWNYYQIEAQYQGQESFATRAMSGVYMQIDVPENIEIEQLNDYQLRLMWNSSKFAKYYRLERLFSDSQLDTVFFTSDTIFIDSSYNLQGNLLENNLKVDGLQPNTDYTYLIYGGDSQAGLERISSPGTVHGVLDNYIPSFSINPVSNNEMRLYINQEIQEMTHYQNITILENINDSGWVIGLALPLLDIQDCPYNDNYRLDMYVQNNNQVASNVSYRIAAHGLVNTMVSEIVSGTTLGVPGFRLVDGGNFDYGCSSCDVYEQDTEINSFYIGMYEATSIIDWPPTAGETFPLDSLSWDQANEYCNVYSSQYPGYTFGLPSEKQREYAAKYDQCNDIEYIYPWSSNEILSYNANYINSGDDWEDAGNVTPVGYYNGDNGTIDSHSSQGAYDVAGNILEWCDGYYDYIEDPQLKPLRGGGYWHEPDLLTTVNRFGYTKDTRSKGIGFRLIIEVQ